MKERPFSKQSDKDWNYWYENPSEAADEIERLQEVLTFPLITSEASSSALFIRVLSEHEKGQPVNGQDLINALMWRVGNQRRELARQNQDIARLKNDIQELTCGDPRLVSSPDETAEHEWVIVYADQDRATEHFSGAGANAAACGRFEHLKAAWTCRLFQCVDKTGYGPAVKASDDGCICLRQDESGDILYTHLACPVHGAEVDGGEIHEGAKATACNSPEDIRQSMDLLQQIHRDSESSNLVVIKPEHP